MVIQRIEILQRIKRKYKIYTYNKRSLMKNWFSFPIGCLSFDLLMDICFLQDAILLIQLWYT